MKYNFGMNLQRDAYYGDCVQKINFGAMVNPDKCYPVLYTTTQNGTKIFIPQYVLGKDMSEPQIKYLFEIGYFKVHQ